MRLRLHPVIAFTLLALVILAFSFGINRWRHKPPLTDAQLVGLLPDNGTIFFANFAVLRDAGLIKALAGVKPAEESDYAAFVQQTDFDYTRDLNVLAGSLAQGSRFFVARGRFDWPKLQGFTEAHGGICRGEECTAPASTPGWWASFREIDEHAIVLAVSKNRNAVAAIRFPPRASEGQLPSSEPIWLRASGDSLKDLFSLPPALRLLAAPLQSAESVLISAGPAEASGDGAFAIRLDALFQSNAAAQAAGKQLQLETNMLKLAMLRGHAQASAGDFSGLLAGGRFEANHQRVYGTWPVSEALLKQLQ